MRNVANHLSLALTCPASKISIQIVGIWQIMYMFRSIKKLQNSFEEKLTY
jgi:hypothetical protein